MRSRRCCHGNGRELRLGGAARQQVRKGEVTKTSGAFKCVLALSLLILCHTQLPLQRGGREGARGCRRLGGGCVENTEEKEERSGVCVSLSQRC